MNKRTISILIIVIAVVAVSVFYLLQQTENEKDQSESTAVKNVVLNFGKSLKDVSLLSPTASQDIENNYKNYVDNSLLTQWENNPTEALGRITSSPWPDRIEITDIKKTAAGNYTVQGNIIEVTSSGESGRRYIIMTLKDVNGEWFITNASAGSYQETSNWNNFNDPEQKISFRYPGKLDAQYISLQEWPPVPTVSEGNQLNCQETSPETSLPQRTIRKIIEGNDYCIRAISEGAAGSVYTEYSYSRVIGGKVVTLDFTLQYPQCGNYPEPKKTECEDERQNFDLDNIINQIFSTVNING